MDTVVFLRALINPRSAASVVLARLWAGEFAPVTSPALLVELLDVLRRPKLRGRFPQIARPSALQALLDTLRNAEVVEPTFHHRVCRDPNDDKFLDCAVAGRADFLVSEDQDLLDLHQFEGVRIVNVVEFLPELRAAGT